MIGCFASRIAIRKTPFHRVCMRHCTKTRWRSSLSRYGMGGHHWKQFNPSSYQQLIHEALKKQVTWFEIAGMEGGDIAMVGAMRSAIERSPELAESPLTITTRIGYRTLNASSGENQELSLIPGDVIVAEEGSQQGSVAHNISSDYVLDTVMSSPLLLDLPEMKKLRVVFLLHK